MATLKTWRCFISKMNRRTLDAAGPMAAYTCDGVVWTSKEPG